MFFFPDLYEPVGRLISITEKRKYTIFCSIQRVIQRQVLFTLLSEKYERGGVMIIGNIPSSNHNI
jgi:hypothetical protein